MTYSTISQPTHLKRALFFSVLCLLAIAFLNVHQAVAANASTVNLTTLSSNEGSWRQKIGTFRVGIVGGKHAVRRTKLAQPFRLALEKALGLPVEIFAAADYQSLALAHAESRVEYAVYSATAFARAWAHCKCIEPLVAPRATDGTSAFQSILVARPGISQTLKALEGKIIAVPGKTSFSGFNYPKQKLRSQGIDLDESNWKLSFYQSAAFSRKAYSKGEVDALFGWRPYRSGKNDLSKRGEDSRGTLYQLTQSKDDHKVVWQSDPIPHGPHAIRKGLAPEARQLLVWFLDGLKIRSPDAYDAIDPVMGGGFQPTKLDAYRILIDDLQANSNHTNSENIKIEKARLVTGLRLTQVSFRR